MNPDLSNINYRYNSLNFCARRLHKSSVEHIGSALFNESLVLDGQIKAYLQKALANKQNIIMSDIAQNVGLARSSVNRRVQTNAELKVLWDKIVEYSYQNTIEPINQKIKQILQNAVNTNTYLQLVDISKEVGRTGAVVKKRIKRDTELSKLWQQVSLQLKKTKDKKSQPISQNSDKNTIDAQTRVSIIEKVLKDAVSKGGLLKLDELVELSGIKKGTIVKDLKNNPNLQALWEQVNHKKNIVANVAFEVKEILLNALEQNEHLLIKDVASKLNLRSQGLITKIYNSDELKELWEKVKINNKKLGKTSTQTNKISQQETSIVDDRIKNLLLKSINDGKSVSINLIAEELNLSLDEVKKYLSHAEIKALWKQNRAIVEQEKRIQLLHLENYLKSKIISGEKVLLSDVAEKFGMSKDACINSIRGSASLNEIWNKKGIAVKEKAKTLELGIKEILENTIANKTSILIPDIATSLNTTYDTIASRLRSNTELKALWEQAKPEIYVGKTSMGVTESAEYTQRIKEVLEEYVKSGEKITLKEIASQLGVNASALWAKVSKTPVLKGLYGQIERKIISDESAEINKKIIELLKSANANKEQISAQIIAQRLGITNSRCYDRLNDNPEINLLWNENKNLILAENKTLDKKIKAELESCIDGNQKVLLKDVAQNLGLSLPQLEKRFKADVNLMELAERLQNIDINNLKIINELSNKNLSREEIFNKLKLSPEKFEELMAMYDKLKISRNNRKDLSISQEEYMNWSLLNKREFELAINELFSKMGYLSQTTPFIKDGGIDIVAQKDDKMIVIECMHNLWKTVDLKELMALQGCKHYFKADSAIYVSNKGFSEYAQNYINQLSANFKVMDLEDVIRNARKYNVNLDNIKELSLRSESNISDYGAAWKLPSKLDLALVNEWRSLKPEVFEKRVVMLFESLGYAVTKPNELNLKGFYLINKNGEKKVIKCHNKQTAPDIDIIRALYGLKDYYGADSVIMVAPPSITAKSKDFIDTINCSTTKENSYKLWNLDMVVDLYNKMKLSQIQN